MAAPSVKGGIDCDVHPAVPSTKVLLPYMSEVWQHTVGMILRGVEHLDLTSYPRNASLSCRADWRPAKGEKPASRLDLVQSHVLDHFSLGGAILNPVHGSMMLTNGDLAAVMCSAVNDWIAAEWLARDVRLSASIIVSLQNPGTAVAEIERLAHDKRFVQVLLLATGEMPLGRRYYWPVYEAAEKHGLAIGVHPGGMVRNAPTQSGFPSTLVEDYITHSQHMGSALISLLAEGVFQKFPALKVVLIESGASWLPASLWRFGKDWRGLRTEVPWIDRVPAEIVRDHVRLTLQPFDAPADPDDVLRLLDHIGSDRTLLFSTDYPHHQFDGDDAIPRGLPAELVKRMLIDNPLETYPRMTRPAAT